MWVAPSQGLRAWTEWKGAGKLSTCICLTCFLMVEMMQRVELTLLLPCRSHCDEWTASLACEPKQTLFSWFCLVFCHGHCSQIMASIPWYKGLFLSFIVNRNSTVSSREYSLLLSDRRERLCCLENEPWIQFWKSWCFITSDKSVLAQHTYKTAQDYCFHRSFSDGMLVPKNNLIDPRVWSLSYLRYLQ